VPLPDVDAALVACASGDVDAFTTVYDALSARAFGLVLQVLRDRSQAEEVTQEVMVDVWRTAPKFDPARGSAAGWVLTMAHRRAVDRVRSVAASGRRDMMYAAKNVDREYDVTSEAAAQSMAAAEVRLALGELSDVQREALQLAYVDGLTHREVAETLGIPLGTAKTRIRDGLLRLRTVMGGRP
jgi:RNA polymerase sigma-70 factor (ECF subfamily)